MVPPDQRPAFGRTPEGVLRQMETFFRTNPREGVNNFDLTTDNSDPNIKITPDIFSAIFSQFPGSPYGFATIALSERGRALSRGEIHQILLDITLPQRIHDLNMPDNPDIYKLIELSMSLKRLPTVLIMLGRIVGTEQPFVGMHALAGLSPSTALQIFQDRVKANYAR